MKRFLVLLVVLAAGVLAAVLSVPSNAAVINGQAISQGQLNTDITAIAQSPDYQCYLNADEYLGTDETGTLPPVNGAGPTSSSGPHSTVTTAFVASYLDTEVGHQLILQIAARHHIALTPAETVGAKATLSNQISSTMSELAQTAAAEQPTLSCGSATPLTGTEVLGTMPTAFVNNEVRFDATVLALEKVLSGVGSTQSDYETYFDKHRATFDTACFTVAQYTSESAAEAAVSQVAAGSSFAKLAAATTGGGPEGCEVLFTIASELPPTADLQQLAVNAVSQPISVDNEYLLVQVTKRSHSTYAAAASAVKEAVQEQGATNTQKALQVAESTATVTLDPRYGTWNELHAQIALPSEPTPVDVLNSGANSPITASAATTTTPLSG